MKPRCHDVARTCVLAVVASALTLVVGAVAAQSSAAPPRVPDAQKPSAPRPAIQLTPAERQAIEAAQARKEQPARVEDALVPTPEDMKPRAADETNTTRIEQLHQSNRVSEVIVTPPGQSHSYVMQNREGRQPFGTTQMSSGGLSVPMFFRFEFGKSLPPATNPPSPPAPPPSR